MMNNKAMVLKLIGMALTVTGSLVTAAAVKIDTEKALEALVNAKLGK